MLPNQPTNFIFGYGSLINTASRNATSAHPIAAEVTARGCGSLATPSKARIRSRLEGACDLRLCDIKA